MNSGAASGCAQRDSRLTTSSSSAATESGSSNGRLACAVSSAEPAGAGTVSSLCVPTASLRLDSIISPTRGGNALLRRRSPLREVSHVVSVDCDGERVQLNQYKLQDAIGRGSYSIVKLAHNQEDGTNYAMKILNKKKIMQRAGMFVRGRAVPARKNSSGVQVSPLERVYREIAILKKLSHPNVVGLVEVLDDPVQDSLYLVFELLDQGTVLEIPTSSPLSEHLARKYFRDVVLGIEYLHYQKVIHRDIKPSNLLLGDDGNVKIADFGVCNEFTGPDAYLTGTSGSPAFMPPEALRAQRHAYSGRASDLWAMGVTLFAMVTGQLPFSDANIVALYHRIQNEPLCFPSSPPLSAELRRLLTAMLQKDPLLRATLADVKHHEWVTCDGRMPLPSEQENCHEGPLQVTDEEVQECARPLPSINTVIMLKTMFRKRSFLHPFRGRSNSAPSVVEQSSDDCEDATLTPVTEATEASYS